MTTRHAARRWLAVATTGVAALAVVAAATVTGVSESDALLTDELDGASLTITLQGGDDLVLSDGFEDPVPAGSLNGRLLASDVQAGVDPARAWSVDQGSWDAGEGSAAPNADPAEATVAAPTVVANDGTVTVDCDTTTDDPLGVSVVATNAAGDEWMRATVTRPGGGGAPVRVLQVAASDGGVREAQRNPGGASVEQLSLQIAANSDVKARLVFDDGEELTIDDALDGIGSGLRPSDLTRRGFRYDGDDPDAAAVQQIEGALEGS